MNLNGLIPTIKDGAVVLWEPNAILRYLAAYYSDGAFVGLVRQATDQRNLEATLTSNN